MGKNNFPNTHHRLGNDGGNEDNDKEDGDH